MYLTCTYTCKEIWNGQKTEHWSESVTTAHHPVMVWLDSTEKITSSVFSFFLCNEIISACFIFCTGQSIDSVKSMLLLHSSSNADRPICIHTQKSTSDIRPLRSYAVHSPCIHMDCVTENQGFTLRSHICSYLHTCCNNYVHCFACIIVIGVLFCMDHWMFTEWMNPSQMWTTKSLWHLWIRQQIMPASPPQMPLGGSVLMEKISEDILHGWALLCSCMCAFVHVCVFVCEYLHMCVCYSMCVLGSMHMLVCVTVCECA